VAIISARSSTLLVANIVEQQGLNEFTSLRPRRSNHLDDVEQAAMSRSTASGFEIDGRNLGNPLHSGLRRIALQALIMT